MKLNSKNIFGILFLTLLLIELYIYFSDFTFSYGKYSFGILILTTLITCLLIPYYIIEKKLKMSLIIITIIFSAILAFLSFLKSFSGTEKIMSKWNIEQYEIIYLTEQYVVGQGSSPFLKLREKYLFNLVYRNIDQTNTKLSYFQIGKTDCLIKFDKSNMEFDLCRKKILKAE